MYFNWACSGNPTKRIRDKEDLFSNLQRSFPLQPISSIKKLESYCDKSYTAVARLLKCSKDSIIFSTGTINALQNLFLLNVFERKTHIITTDLEFPTAISFLQAMSENIATVQISNSKSKSGIINSFNKLLKTRTNIVFLSHVAYSNGLILPLSDIISVIRAKAPKALIVIDGSQAVGQIPVYINNLDIDLYLFSTDKWLNGPPVGVTICKNRTVKEKLIALAPSPFAVNYKYRGNKHSKSGVDAASVATLSYVIDEFLKRFDFENGFEKIKALRNNFIKKLEENISIITPRNCELDYSGIVGLEIKKINSRDYDRLYKYLLVNQIILSQVTNYHNEENKSKQRFIIRFSFHQLNSSSEINTVAYILANRLTKYSVILL